MRERITGRVHGAPRAEHGALGRADGNLVAVCVDTAHAVCHANLAVVHPRPHDGEAWPQRDREPVTRDRVGNVGF